MKTSRQRFMIELTKELRETIHAYERKLRKLTPIVEYLESSEIQEFRRIIYNLMQHLQDLETLKKVAQERAAKSSPKQLLVIE